jgi:hypothetical protein
VDSLHACWFSPHVLCRYSLLLFQMRLLVHMILFYLVSKQFHYSIKIFVTHFLAFYKLIDKISSFLLFPFPPFSHFLFSKSLSNFFFFHFFCLSLSFFSLFTHTHIQTHEHIQLLWLHIHSTSRIFTLSSLLSVSQHVSLKTWNGPLFNSMSYPLL